jgi:transposase-like protein
MSIVTLRLPEVKCYETKRPVQCPNCKGEIFQRWGGKWRRLKDPKVQQGLIYRYRCCTCGRTFRQYPEGVNRGSQTNRMVKLAAIFWALGMSYRHAAAILGVFGIQLAYMSIWRDVQKQAEQVRRSKQWGKVRVMGVDGLYVKGWGETQPVIVAVDLGTGQPIELGYLDEKDPQAVRKFLEPLVQRLGVSVIVTDDLSSYKVAARALDLEQQVCQFHLRRWVGKALHDLRILLPEEWHKWIDEVMQLVQELPIEGEKRLVQIYRQIPVNRTGRREEPMTPLEQFRHLVGRLAEDWAKYRVFDWQPQVPWTNNQTEQAIGRMKMRARTVRGYKSESGMLNGLLWSATAIS